MWYLRKFWRKIFCLVKAVCSKPTCIRKHLYGNWKKKKSSIRHFTELSAEISLTWTKSVPSKTLFLMWKYSVISSFLAPLCIFFHSSPIYQFHHFNWLNFLQFLWKIFKIYYFASYNCYPNSIFTPFSLSSHSSLIQFNSKR